MKTTAKTTMKKALTFALSLLLLLALLLSFASCKEEANDTESPSVPTSTTTEVSTSDTTETPTEEEITGIWKDALYTKDVTLGEGTKTVLIEVEADGRSITVTVKTDEDILGKALLSLGLVVGEQGAYGLYIKRVNGMLADYDVDQTYWAFYQNGEYMMTGVDATSIKGGEHFELVRTK